jgi:hypothetical protein
MPIGKRPKLGAVFGFVSVAILGHIWIVFLAPIKWNLSYPVGDFWVLVTMLVAIMMSIAAGMLGTRQWFFLTVVAVGTFVYIGWIYRTPMWN